MNVRIKVVFYYIIRLPVIGLVKIMNWIAFNYPCNGKRFTIWDRIFMLLDKVVTPTLEFEHWLWYKGYIKIKRGLDA